ncbi:MAG: hypothetical protein SPG61_07700 [Arcanobacterium sp.]|nr:hypothetical protein [Arcanobacterium sp.]
MRKFLTLQDAFETLAGEKKWDRTFEAIHTAFPYTAAEAHLETQPTASAINPLIFPGVTYSVGDSLTWRIITQTDSETDLERSHRYLRVFYCHAGEINIHLATNFAPKTKYSDLSDRQYVTGTAEINTLKAGEILFCEITEATQLHPQPESLGVALRVTVEGRSFHNK